MKMKTCGKPRKIVNVGERKPFLFYENCDLKIIVVEL